MADRRVFMEVIKVEDFLRNPPKGFVVNRHFGHTLVKFDPNSCCAFIDEFYTEKGKIIFQFSPGRKCVVNNLGDYTKMRKKITSQRIYLLASASDMPASRDGKLNQTSEESEYFIVVLNGSHPAVRWQMEQGLDRTISSVAGESYSVEIDLSQALHSWVERRKNVLPSVLKGKSWGICSFTLKYHSDALFDFSFWFGRSKRHFKINYKY
ncbi:mesenteric estrogen-dependent adipogenesis protein-like [Engraulis encrasicolus]|uniref:mesenteric estrogen-dependent adipogenesis protein-like n=1 Tax=Engraulis encrasicolus TaxID=184585 RepID=UPI002FD30411